MIILRRTKPDMPRTFKVALFPVTPILGAIACGYMMFELDAATWMVFGGWMIVGLVFYFLYGIRRSRLATEEEVATAEK